MTNVIDANDRAVTAASPRGDGAEPPSRDWLVGWPADFRLFLAVMAAFWTPVLLPIALLEAFLWRMGETQPLPRIVAIQRAEGATFLRKYNQDLKRYKYSGLLASRPRILALGSSRVMQFRAEMFGEDPRRDCGGFYNAGGLIQEMDDLSEFASLTDELRNTEVIIIGIDMWWLNSNYPRRGSSKTAGLAGFAQDIKTDAAFDWQNHALIFRDFVLRPPMSTRLLRALLLGEVGNGRLGLGAKIAGGGFRVDGSLSIPSSSLPDPYPSPDGKFRDPEQPTVAERIRKSGKNTGKFATSDGVSPERLEQLRRAVTRLRDRGILVIGFNPPVSTDAAAMLEASEGHRVIWSQYRQSVPALFAGLALPFFDASVPSNLNLDDFYMLDGFHGFETFHVYLLQEFLRDPRVDNALPHAREVVERALASPATDRWYPDLGLPPAETRGATAIASPARDELPRSGTGVSSHIPLGAAPR